MKKCTVLFLFILFFSFNIVNVALADNTFKEGVYKLSDFNVSTNNVYTVQNISKTGAVFMQVFDENRLVIQSMFLNPTSAKYTLLPLKPDYRIVFVGKGEIYLFEATP